MTLEDLKAGDTVALSTHYRTRLKAVDRTTPTQIIVGHMRYRKVDGSLVGGAASALADSNIFVPTEEELATLKSAAKRRKMVARLDGTAWNTLPDAVLVACCSLLP